MLDVEDVIWSGGAGSLLSSGERDIRLDKTLEISDVSEDKVDKSWVIEV